MSEVTPLVSGRSLNPNPFKALPAHASDRSFPELDPPRSRGSRIGEGWERELWLQDSCFPKEESVKNVPLSPLPLPL